MGHPGNLERINKIPDWAKEVLATFAISKSLKENTVDTYVNALLAWRECMGDLEPWKASEEEARRAISCLSEGRSKGTVNLYLARLKTLVRYVHGETPEEWKKVKVRLRKGEIRDKLLSREEIQKLIDAASSAKVKALIATVYDGALRISEALSLRIRDLTPYRHDGAVVGYVASIKGKTGERTILLVDSYPYLREWLLVHPLPDKEMPLFPGKEPWRPLSRKAAEDLFKTVRKRAGLKHVTWHWLRHTRLTELVS